MKKLVLKCMALSLLHSIFLMCSDSGYSSDSQSSSGEELQKVIQNSLSAEEQQSLEERPRPTWKKILNYLNPEVYEGIQELQDGTIIKLIAFSEQEKNEGGRRVTTSSPDSPLVHVPFQEFPVTIPQRLDQEQKSSKGSPIIPMRRMSHDNAKDDDSDYVSL